MSRPLLIKLGELAKDVVKVDLVGGGEGRCGDNGSALHLNVYRLVMREVKVTNEEHGGGEGDGEERPYRIEKINFLMVRPMGRDVEVDDNNDVVHRNNDGGQASTRGDDNAEGVAIGGEPTTVERIK